MVTKYRVGPGSNIARDKMPKMPISPPRMIAILEACSKSNGNCFGCPKTKKCIALYDKIKCSNMIER